MSRLAVPAHDGAPAASQPLLAAVEGQVGSVPNRFRLLGSSPAVPEGFLGLSASLGRSGHPRIGTALAFAARVALERGRVTDADPAAVKLAGHTDAQVVEIVANVALNVMTNFLNTVAQTNIDFPVVRAAEAA